MKKISAFLIFSVLITGGASAAEKVGADAARAAHREEMKTIKAKMREERKNQPAPKGVANGFWAKEAERSGMNHWNPPNLSEVAKNMNPVPFFQEQQRRYNERKAATQK